ncbi:hypothetical protein ACN38_g11463 [Penicillium nordicum]|uniref:Uncharacterized protein n=1 Tax=Penicillium nordicum TaxID=229535 RepID=A0A0M8NYS0_9EURO|nr:hypothetical protein ACN38_g11463 [Penicillium nordicum]
MRMSYIHPQPPSIRNEIQQLLQRKYSGSRATTTSLTTELCEGNRGGKLPDDKIHVGRHWRHELYNKQVYPIKIHLAMTLNSSFFNYSLYNII